MTDEKSIEERLDDPDADRHALGDDILVRLDRDERLFATCGDPETARDCRDALAEIRRLREELDATRDSLASERGVGGKLDALGWTALDMATSALKEETARRESAEALLRGGCKCPACTEAIGEHFARYAPSGSGQTKEIDR